MGNQYILLNRWPKRSFVRWWSILGDSVYLHFVQITDKAALYFLLWFYGDRGDTTSQGSHKIFWMVLIIDWSSRILPCCQAEGHANCWECSVRSYLHLWQEERSRLKSGDDSFGRMRSCSGVEVTQWFFACLCDMSVCVACSRNLKPDFALPPIHYWPQRNTLSSLTWTTHRNWL